MTPIIISLVSSVLQSKLPVLSLITFSSVCTAQNNFTLTLTLNYFFSPNRLLTSRTELQKSCARRQSTALISCIYIIHNTTTQLVKCDPQIKELVKQLSKYLNHGKLGHILLLIRAMAARQTS